MQERFEVQVTKDYLVFCAGHFITYRGNLCESIHGHNWHVQVEVAGPLDENYYVFDFVTLKHLAKGIVEQLDHRMLLPEYNRFIKVARSQKQIEVTFEDRFWSFPANECVILPIENTTTELIARWFAKELLNRLQDQGHAPPPILRVRLEENFGQWASVELAAV